MFGMSSHDSDHRDLEQPPFQTGERCTFLTMLIVMLFLQVDTYAEYPKINGRFMLMVITPTNISDRCCSDATSSDVHPATM